MLKDEDLIAQLKPMIAEMLKRARQSRLMDTYYEGSSPIPAAIAEAKVTKAYKLLMPMAEAPWGSLIADSVLDRLEVTGIRSPDGKRVDDKVWNAWQDNQMDSESKLAISSSLVSGRAFATVWPENGGEPEITIDNAEQVIVKYREGSRRHREAACRVWIDEDTNVPHATLYRPDGTFKFIGRADQSLSDAHWTRRIVPGEEWPLPNPFKRVNVVELPVNRRLKGGTYGHARGEFEHCTGLIDRINLLTFLGLVVAFYMGFPLRGVIGEKIRERVLTDDEGNEIGKEIIPPFDSHAAGTAQLENPDAKIFEYQAADRKNLSIFPELAQLSAITKTPRHYFPLEQAMSNLAADAIRADEGGLSSKVRGLHKPSLGEGFEEVLRLCGMMSKDRVELSPRAELQWADHESRSLAERADAVSKLKDALPWQGVAEVALGATQDQIARWQSLRDGEAFGELVRAASRPFDPPASTEAPAAVPAAA